MAEFKRDYGSGRDFVAKVRLSPMENEDLERIARCCNKSKSDIIRDALRQYSQRFWRYSDNYLQENPGVMTVFDD